MKKFSLNVEKVNKGKKSYKLNQFSRTELLIGRDGIDKLKNSKVAVFGIGGVGSFVVEGLVRAGVGNFVLIDDDKVCLTNLNRQIITNTSNISKLKTDEMEKRILSINPNCNVTKLNIKLDLDNMDKLFNLKFDYLIDCCDTVVVKQELIKRCLNKKIKFISSMGTGNKLNPDMLEVVDISKTSYDPIAKKIRKYLKDNKIKGKVPVVYSKEQNNKFTGSIPSMVFVPATSGLLCSNYIIKCIINS